MIDTDKQYKRQNKWQKEHTERLSIALPIGKKEVWRQKAAAENKSLTEYVIMKVDQE